MGRKPDPNKKQHIINTAAQIFAQRGYAGTRILEIAEAAGIGKGTVYEYFRSKDDLFFAVFQFIIQEPATQLQGMLGAEGGSAAKRIEMIADAVIQSWLPRLDQYSLVMEFWSAATTLPSRERFKSAFRRAYADMRDLSADLIRQGVAGGEFNKHTESDKIAMAMVGAMDFLLLQAWLDPGFDAGDVLHSFLKVMFKGLQPPKDEEKL